jgi:predicted metal-binding membrane protein
MTPTTIEARMIGGSGAMTLAGERHAAAGERAFRAAATLLFAASTLATVWWCGSMSDGMAMPGGWTMSMAWMRMPGQTWPAAAASFMAMWILMMVAMMLPSLVPMLSRYRRALPVCDERRLATLTAVVGAGYFFAWAVFGAAVYPLGVVLAAAEMRSPALARSVPMATGLVLVLAGCLQQTAWKRRALTHCREVRCARSLPADGRTAWSHGVDLGVHCGLCCSALMAAMLVTDTMNLRTMALIATAVTIERVAPEPELVARTTGMLLAATGELTNARAALG